MGFFGGYETAPPPELLQTPWSEDAIRRLMELIRQPFNLPTEAYDLGMGEIKKTLGGAYDPFHGEFYKGLREKSLREEERGVGKVRQAAQMGGGLYGERRLGAEGEYRAEMGTGRTSMLGGLYEGERGRRAGMIPQALEYGKFATEQELIPRQMQTSALQWLADYGNWYQPEQLYKPGLLDYLTQLAPSILKIPGIGGK
ncbi:hypothetical protein ES708_09087 [subsurface metagenome]